MEQRLLIVYVAGINSQVAAISDLTGPVLMSCCAAVDLVAASLRGIFNLYIMRSQGIGMYTLVHMCAVLV